MKTSTFGQLGFYSRIFTSPLVNNCKIIIVMMTFFSNEIHYFQVDDLNSEIMTLQERLKSSLSNRTKVKYSKIEIGVCSHGILLYANSCYVMIISVGSQKEHFGKCAEQQSKEKERRTETGLVGKYY